MGGSEPTSNDNPVTYKEAFPAAKEGDSDKLLAMIEAEENVLNICLLYTSPSPRDQRGSRMPSSA